MPPLAHPDLPSTPAKELFARKTEPVPLAARSIGFYSHGCLAGAVALPIDGSTWQVMRLSRNRNWGHPQLIDFLERLAGQAKKSAGTGCSLATCRSHEAVPCSAATPVIRSGSMPISG